MDNVKINEAWTITVPVWEESKCRQCLVCTPVCPDMLIPIKTGKRTEFDYDNCNGCGRCAKVCPYGAINMNERLLEVEA
jgi:pyruvate ferredoxin oxidoreductase delta subunit